MLLPRDCHGDGRGPGSCGWIVNFCAPQDGCRVWGHTTIITADDKHFPIFSRGRRGKFAAFVQASRPLQFPVDGS